MESTHFALNAGTFCMRNAEWRFVILYAYDSKILSSSIEEYWGERFRTGRIRTKCGIITNGEGSAGILLIFAKL